MTVPTITSAGAAQAVIGVAFTFTVTATGTPTPALSVSQLPAWITFVDNGNGTGTMTGTPPSGSPPAPFGEQVFYSTVSAVNANGSANQQFTLSVNIAPSTPSTAVTPQTPGLPTGTVINIPFHIDPATGGVAVISDYATILAQGIANVLQTLPGERVMLPTYGTPVRSLVFEPINNVLPGFLMQDIQSAIAQWNPSVTVEQVAVGADPTNHGAIAVTVFFSVQPFAGVSAVSVSVGGGITQVVS